MSRKVHIEHGREQGRQIPPRELEAHAEGIEADDKCTEEHEHCTGHAARDTVVILQLRRRSVFIVDDNDVRHKPEHDDHDHLTDHE